MGKKRRRTPASSDEQNEENVNDAKPRSLTEPPGTLTTLCLSIVLVFVARIVFGPSSTSPASESNGIPPPFVVRLLLYVALDESFGRAFSTLFLPLARSLARCLPGASVPDSPEEVEEQERTKNDPTLVWPISGTVLPDDWTSIAGGQYNMRIQQPYFLNHVRGSTRVRHAARRVGLAFGTVCAVSVMGMWVDLRPVGEIGLEVPSIIDIIRGFLVGAAVVVALFAAEVSLGWLKVVGYGEVISPGESLLVNLTWDVIFHVGVSVNEELSMRGWMLVRTAQWMAASEFGVPAYAAMALSVTFQSALFAFLHIGSPGATRVGLLNLVVGGTAAALNVFLSGGLSFGLGWHFGWNISMGHWLGMSTSGIPMSAKIVSVVPHPAKAHLHGGKFGPEQSPLAPLAYVLGCVALVAIYGMEGLGLWRERLDALAQ